MYLFNYDPKWKKELPIWDTHPIVFPFTVLQDRFYGLNLHYLPHKQRAYLMDILDTIKNNNRYDTTTKLKLSWKVLKEIAKREDYEVTIHCYLKKHIKSRLKYVLPMEWHYTAFLPLASWQGPEREKYRAYLK